MEDLKRAILEAGELGTLSDLARRWGVSRQAATKMSRRPDFPTPLVKVGEKTVVYIVAEADAYRNRKES